MPPSDWDTTATSFDVHPQCNYDISPMEASGSTSPLHSATTLTLSRVSSVASFWYSGNGKSMMLANCMFRSGGCFILLRNRDNLSSKSIMKLKCAVRTHLGANEEAFSCCSVLKFR
nr:3-ketoacyl-CoA synthase 12-like [Ipomoea batatas]